MEEFEKKFPRPLFIIIFRPEMLKFHPYSILTRGTMVGFVIFCVLISKSSFNQMISNQDFLSKSEYIYSPIPLLSICTWQGGGVADYAHHITYYPPPIFISAYGPENDKSYKFMPL